MSAATIRAPRDSDADAIAALVTELGYPSSAAEIPARLAALSAESGSAVWVAELDRKVIGIATGRAFAGVHVTAPVAWLTALVVAEAARGKGVGKQLMAVAETWARERGAAKLALTSALHRDAAHQFYKNLGYEHTGVRLAKTLKR